MDNISEIINEIHILVSKNECEFEVNVIEDVPTNLNYCVPTKKLTINLNITNDEGSFDLLSVLLNELKETFN